MSISSMVYPDWSIPGDPQEQERIRLENQLGRDFGHLSLERSSTDYSLEFARHAPHHSPSPFGSYHPDGQLGYRFDDSIAVAGESMSTAAHHASALTIGAGLHTRKHSSSPTAEYDPERRLPVMLDGRGHVSYFDNTTPGKGFSTDPMMVETTAELDRVLRSGRRRRSHIGESDGNSDITSEPASPRPRLTDALGTHFSPKRPTTTLPASKTRHNQPAGSFGLRFGRSSPSLHAKDSTPATSSKLARGARENDKTETSTPVRRPFEDIGNKSLHSTRRKAKAAGTSVHLPDVTGLTSAVTSPNKAGVSYYTLDENAEPGRPDAAVVDTALESLSRRLRELEKENGTSRRRVRELEMELEVCKAEVVKERTRVHEIMGDDQKQNAKGKARVEVPSASKAHKSVWTEPSMNEEVRSLERRYKQVVEEKKALEALVTSLRAHLARMTSELENHQRLVKELRSLRERDAADIETKRHEVEELQAEVERLGGEIERLRDVVESGLQERRRAREESQGNIQESVLASQPDEYDDYQQSQFQEDDDSFVDDEQTERDRLMETRRLHDEEQARLGLSAIMEIDEPESVLDKTPSTQRVSKRSTSPRAPPPPHSPTFSHNMERPRSSSSRRFIDQDELLRVQDEVQERQSLRAASQGTVTPDGSQQGEPSIHPERRPTDLPPIVQPWSRSGKPRPVSPQFSRHPPRPSHPVPPTPKTPAFPQIRGAMLERMFFSAPEHNEQTCTVCHRRKRRVFSGPSPSTGGPGLGQGSDIDLAWLKRKPTVVSSRAAGKRKATSRYDEDTFEEIDDNTDQERNPDLPEDRHPDRHSHPARGPPSISDKDRLPPQTVLARVVRELEDDFTHYKSVYIELADQYKLMDAASNIIKRNVLAEHLQEVISTLEQKGNHIASLYELLKFKDKPLPAETEYHPKTYSRKRRFV